MIGISKKNKELLREMYEMYEEDYIVNFSTILGNIAKKYEVIVDVVKDSDECQIVLYYVGENYESTKMNHGVTEFLSVLFFLEKLVKENLVHTIPNMERWIPFGLAGYKFDAYNCPCTLKIGSYVAEFNYISRKFTCNAQNFHYNIEDNTYNFLNKTHLCVFDSELLHFIENGFVTDEEIWYGKQLSVIKEELKEMKCSNEKEHENAKIANRISKKACAWAVIGVLSSMVFGFVTACLMYFGTYKMDEKQFEAIRQSIESIKSLDVEDEKLLVGDNVDTVTIKSVNNDSIKQVPIIK